MSEMATAADAAVFDAFRPRSERWLRRPASRFAGRPNRPVFIGACPRSGTTLLRSMLDNHPDLAMPGETDFVVPLWERRVGFGDLRDPANRRAIGEWVFLGEGRGGDRLRAGRMSRERAIERVVASPPTLGSVFATCFALYAEVHGKPRWGAKRPGFAGVIGAIFALFPDAQFINLIRDPRAAVASLRRLGWHREDVAVAASTATWEMSVARVDAISRRLRPDQLIDVRYEDMVRDPQATLRRICALTGLRDGDTIEQMITAKRRGRFRAGWHDRLKQPISTAPIDAWRERLAPHEIALVEHATRRQLPRLGYRPVADLDAVPEPAALEELERQRRRRRQRWRRLALDELKRRCVLYRRPVAAQPRSDGATRAG